MTVRDTFPRLVRAFPVAVVAPVFLAGIIVWGGFNWSLELTNTERFCISCHVMENYVYNEYKETVHYTNRTGVRATCPDCHVPKEWVHKVVRKVGAANELFHWALGSIETREKFEAKRSQLARHVWASMERTDSRECRNCHGIGFMSPKAQNVQARVMHELAAKWKMTCIECHKGIAHSLPKDFDNQSLMDRLHERMEQEKVNCRQCHKDMAGPPRGQGWDDSTP